MNSHQKIEQNLKTLPKDQVYTKSSKQILDKILSYSSLQIQTQIDYRAISISEKDHLHEIYTINKEVQKQLPHIVLLHGFGGAGMVYVRMFKTLREHYQVHALDTFGIGHSSRGQFKATFTEEQAKNYYIDAIQAWRKEVKITEFTLVGHSFGGYLATCYTQKYPQIVNRLVLLSPVGASDKSQEQIQEQLQKRSQRNLSSKIFMFVAEKIYNFGFSPSNIMGNWMVGQKLINRVVDQRLKLIDSEKDAWKQYFKELSRIKENSERGFYIIFKWPLRPSNTIESIFNRLEFSNQIEFYYGDHDWMDSAGAKRLAISKQNISFKKITNADHQLTFDNPQQVCYYILKSMKKFDEQ